MTAGPENALAATYGVELLLERRLQPDSRGLLAALQAHFPGLYELPTVPLQYVHAVTPAGAGMGAVPPGFCVIPSGAPVDADAVAAALQQTRGWPEARSVAARVGAAVYVGDIIASSIAPALRLDLFVSALRIVVEHIPPIAILWLPAQRMVEPACALRAIDDGEADRFVQLAVNVRSFRTGPTTTLMDTLGLAPFGVTDLQCHYDSTNVDPNEMAGKLYNYAFEAFQKGDFIGEGHTIEGFTKAETWSCTHSMSLAPPGRRVIDIDAGRHAA